MISKFINLRTYSKFVSFSVLVLIFYGALVKSHEAGLAVPDWPTSFGENMFLFHPSKWIGIIYYEHVHRLIASFIGLLTLILAMWLWVKEERTTVKLLGFFALFLVIIQGVLGGLTVIYKLPLVVSASHGVLAQTFLCITLMIAYSQSREWSERDQSRVRGAESEVFSWAIVLLGLVFMQLIVGAVMRHLEAGLAVLDFPRMAGAFFPTINSDMLALINNKRSALNMPAVDAMQVAIHILHRVGALIVFVATCGFLVVAKGKWAELSPRVRMAVHLYVFALLAQISLGIFSVLSLREPVLTSLHVVTGAALLGSTLLMAMRTYSGVKDPVTFKSRQPTAGVS